MDPSPLPQSAGPAPAAASPAAPATRLRQLSANAPLGWIRRGLADFGRAPAIGLFYGACFAAMGWVLDWIFAHAPAYTLALSAGFLLMGPFLCVGLYEVSRRLEQGRPPSFLSSLTAWRTRAGTMAIFGGVLLILEMVWGRAALIVFAVSFDGMPDFRGSLFALLDPENIGFIVAYLSVGGLFAGLIFAVSVIAIPMILDRQTDAVTAGLASLRLCLSQPLVMLLWGALLTMLVVLALLPWYLGLLVVGPVLGHASWHAYRDAVEA